VSKRTLLLADDSVTIQKVVNLTFADEGIEVVTVGDGDSAMQKISEISPDVVLADVHMPGLSGYQICEIVRDNPVTRNLPVVLLVGSFEPFDESEAARVGANAYLTKPFQSIRQLVTQVTDLMQSATPEESSQPEPVQPEPDTIEQPPFAKAPDTTDIDHLYHQSFDGPGAQMKASQSEVAEESHNAFGDQTYSEAETEAPPFIDAGMDDEMIETSRLDAVEQPSEAPIYDHQEERGYEDLGQSEEPSSEAPESEYTTKPQYTFDPNVTTEEIVHEEPPEMGWATPGEQPPGTGAFDSFAEDRGEPPAVHKADDERVVEFDEFSRTEQIPASVTASALNLDDLELLDLPPLENGKTQEFTAAQRSDVEGGGKEIVSLSPELMDQLVQRVVEKLSKDK
jgi:CheY-like chemotaxis protein